MFATWMRRMAQFAAFCVLHLSAHAAPPVYRIHEVEKVPVTGNNDPSVQIYAINDHGEMLGQYYTFKGTRPDALHIAVWKADGQLTERTGLPGDASNVRLAGMNNRGQVTGSYSTVQSTSHEPGNRIFDNAFVLDPDGSLAVLASAEMPECPCPFLPDWFVPVAINDRGVVLGRGDLEFPLHPAFRSHALLWAQRTGVRDVLKHSVHATEPIDINDKGEVLATYLARDALTGQLFSRAFVASARNDGIGDAATGHRLTELPEAVPRALNNRGQVVGIARHQGHQEAFVWDAQAGARPLGTLDCGISTAVDINDAGQVIGTSCTAATNFYYDDESGMVPLESLMDPDDPLRAKYGQITVLKINAKGQIAATAPRSTGRYRAYPLRLDPVR